VTRLLIPIGFEVGPPDRDGVLAVTPPSFRPDALSEIDLVEEVARHHGYANIARTTVRPTQVGGLTPHQRERRLVREVLAGAGLSEATGNPLVAPGDHPRAGLPESEIVATDPLAREESVLRTSPLPGLLRAVAFNQDRRNPDVGLFEIGHVWRPPHPSMDMAAGPDLAPGHGLPEERELVAVALAGARAGGGHDAAAGPAAVQVLQRLIAALRLDAVTLSAGDGPGLHPSRSAEVLLAGKGVGWVGEADPDVVAAWGIEGAVGWLQVDLPALLSGHRTSDHARPVSRFPSSDLDLAFIVEDREPAASVKETLARAAGDLLEWVQLFDVYRGGGVPAGSRSLAFRLRFAALDRTLNDAELAQLREDCIRAVESDHPASLRR
jgi:phenylalanyl-tRNA synthetase beta chain